MIVFDRREIVYDLRGKIKRREGGKEGTGRRKQETGTADRAVIPAKAGIQVSQTELGSPLSRG
jgi:hypothetical protein